jgi:hypothetical protein
MYCAPPRDEDKRNVRDDHSDLPPNPTRRNMWKVEGEKAVSSAKAMEYDLGTTSCTTMCKNILCQLRFLESSSQFFFSDFIWLRERRSNSIKQPGDARAVF